MNKSAQYLVANYPMLAKVAIFTFILSFLTIVPATLLAVIRPEVLENEATARVVALLLLFVLAASIAVMVLATRIVWLARANLTDWHRFLLITWLIPYLGVTALVSSAFLEQIRSERDATGAH